MRIVTRVLVALTLVALSDTHASLQDTPAAGVQIVEISAERFSFTPSEIRVKAGTRLELRGQFAQVAIRNADLLNDALGRAVGVDPNVARTLRGFYGEAGFRVISGASYGEVGLFTRYENFDTQFRMPNGYLPLKEFDRDALVFGATYWPDPDIALKVDYSGIRSKNSTIREPNTFNIGLGWWF